jgi:hypothetical protein
MQKYITNYPCFRERKEVLLLMCLQNKDCKTPKEKYIVNDPLCFRMLQETSLIYFHVFIATGKNVCVSTTL